MRKLNSYKFNIRKNNELTIITACCRPENLEIIANNFHDFSGRWLIVLDSMPKKLFDLKFKLSSCNFETKIINCNAENEDIPNFYRGEVIKNFGLDFLQKENYNSSNYVYFLDDDNLLHPDFYSTIHQTINQPNPPDLIGFDQIRETYYNKLHEIAAYQIDQAQYVVRFGLIENDRIPHVYVGDSLFANKLQQKTLHSTIIEKPLCFYNRIKWREAV